MREDLRRRLVAASVLTGLGLLALNLMLFSVRVDLTAERAFSVMPQTRAVWERLDDPVAVRYYLSGTLRDRTVETRHIEEYLEEYAGRAGGRIEYRVLDPDESEARRREAEELGVVPQRVQLQRGPEQQAVTVYSGIVLEYRDRREVIPLAFDANEIEFELTAAIAALERGERPELGVVIGDPGISIRDSLQLAANQLSRRFRLRVVDPGETIPDSLSGILVIGNSELGSEAVDRLQAFIAAGGGAVIAADGLRVEPEIGARVQPVEQLYMTELLGDYGVNLHPALVLDPRNRPIPVEREVGDARVEDEEPYPFWPALEDLAGEHPVNHAVPGISLLWPSRLELDVVEGMTPVGFKATVLARSSPESWYLEDPNEVSPGALREPAPQERFSGGYPLAVALERPENREGGRVVIVSGSRSFSDMLQLAAPRGTLWFLDNAAHWVTGNEDLAVLRREAPTERRLDAVTQPAARAFHGWLAAVLNAAVIPLAIIVAGAWYRRRRVRRAARVWSGAQAEDR